MKLHQRTKADDVYFWELETRLKVERELSIDWEKTRNWIEARRDEDVLGDK